MNILTLQNVTYKYEGTRKNVLRGINATFEAGKVYAIAGRSGSGKSTLLSLIAGLDVCTTGKILYGHDDLKDIDRDEYRAKGIGVIFQAYNLITNATAIDNIVLSMHIGGSKEPKKKAYAQYLLNKVGIDKETAGRKVLKLSGGEQQRVGIARAIAHDPEIIIADEPTGNLDAETEKEVLKILTDLAHNEKKCVIIVTHFKSVSSKANRVFNMQDGLLV